MARECRDKFAKKARYTGYAQNAAIGLQVLLGSLTTGLSAVATTGRQVSGCFLSWSLWTYLLTISGWVVLNVDGSTDDDSRCVSS